VPGPWTSLKLEQMLPVLRAYGALAAREILKTGVQVRIWDIGNEVEFGAAGVAVRPLPGGCDDTAGGSGWYKPPDRIDAAIGKMSLSDLMKLPEAERIGWLEAHIWPNLARMLAAVAAGIKSVDPNARFSTHASGITAVIPAQAVAFYKALKTGGFFPDELGFSFYPSSSDNPPNRVRVFERTMEKVHKELGRPVFIAEFGYPSATLTDGPFAGWNFMTERYPLTAQGQANMLHDLTAWAAASGISGIRPWAPEVVLPGWGPFSLFGLHGKSASANAGLSAIADGVPSAK
jgi:arabinogalactan endo-1,4-beta-galactosidase